MRARACLSICVTAIALATGCGETSGEDSNDPKPLADPARVEGAPLDSGVALDGAPVAIEGAGRGGPPLAGVAAIATERGLFRARTDGTFVRVPFHDEATDPRILALTRREGGLLALTDRGLYHDAQGFLVRSPLSDTIAPLGVKRVDVTKDTVWLTADQGAFRVRGGQLEKIAVPGLDAAPEAVVGIREDAVLVASPSGIRVLDLTALTVRELGAFGRVAAFDRSDDGKVHLATEQGLLSCGVDLACSVRTFAEASQPARAVTGVSAAFGTLSAVVGDMLVTIDASARVVARTPAGTSAVAIDAAGDAWFVARGAAARAQLGAPPSFERDVVPFFDKHCLGCHSAGANGAPVLPLRDYTKAVQLAPLVVRRIRAEGAPPMPPSSVERLVPADYAAVVRWAATGTKP